MPPTFFYDMVTLPIPCFQIRFQDPDLALDDPDIFLGHSHITYSSRSD